jgi:diaminopimelate decarboxylase
MNAFDYRDGVLHAEDVSCAELADKHGTPLFVYSRAAIEASYRAFEQALADRDHLICYAIKANSNLGVLSLLAKLGAGFDIVSAGELARVIAAGGEPGKIVFSGVGKTADEMRAALNVGIRCFNVESEAELERLNEVAGELGKVAPVSLRINPDVDAKTHPYISTGLKENKFGIAIDRARQAYARAAELPNLAVHGVDCHIGSQLTQIDPYIDALDRLLALIDQLAEDGISIRHLDLGGGQGIRYRDETPIDLDEWARRVSERMGDRALQILVEPGRSIVGNAGLLLTRVEYLKHHEHKDFAIVDAAMNDLIRPSLYGAWQAIVPVQPRDAAPREYDIVGPICETGDFLGKQRELALEQGDLLAVRSAGAYGFTMSSNYNSRPRAAEIIVDGEQAHVVRERETIESLFAGESRLPG